MVHALEWHSQPKYSALFTWSMVRRSTSHWRIDDKIPEGEKHSIEHKTWIARLSLQTCTAKNCTVGVLCIMPFISVSPGTILQSAPLPSTGKIPEIP